MIFLLNNPIQNYAWGSIDAMHNIFNIKNNEKLPQAEMWMGAHPNGCSQLPNEQKLSNYIAQNPAAILGSKVFENYAVLPFLMKVLAASKPLSIQVHPSKASAEAGYLRENELGIDKKDPSRNYKDPNHKPELIYAITPFLAMNGFRSIKEIVYLFYLADIKILKDDVNALRDNPTPMQLRTFFKRILKLAGRAKQEAIAALLDNIKAGIVCSAENQFIFEQILDFSKLYPADVGLFAPLLLNIIELKPGEAMFLYAQTPHAYIRGTGIEIMANSDNVLRAGLTPKHMDISELLVNTKFACIDKDDLILKPEIQENRAIYPIGVDDFSFDIISLESNRDTLELDLTGAEIIFCIDGKATLRDQYGSITINKGQAVFIGADSKYYRLEGSARLARAYV